jgi:competence protein ComEA
MRSATVFLLILFMVLAVPPMCSAAAVPQDAPVVKAPAAAATVVNLNTATSEQLQKLPGIGPRTAARIIEYRQKSGGFKKIEELMNVKGIGEKSFLRLKAQVTVSPAKADVP